MYPLCVPDAELPEVEIDYPTQWSYKLIGPDEAGLRDAIAAAVDERHHDISVSRRSSGGKYVSLRLELIVTSHEDRRGIANTLHVHAAVKFVL